MQATAIVTGGGSGIGRAIACALAERGLRVLIAGRREGPLQAVRSEARGEIVPVVADLSTAEGRRQLVEAVPTDGTLRALVHNAALLEPVHRLAEVDLEEWRQHQAVNVEAPLFLTQALLSALQGGGRVLHISSGAAHHPYPAWGAYCTSKAALHMLYQVWQSELQGTGLYFGSVRPGVVDTPMQTHIREIPSERFPRVARFRELHAQGQLRSPEEVGDFVSWLLLDVPAEEYEQQEWDLGDPAHRHRWQRTGGA